MLEAVGLVVGVSLPSHTGGDAFVLGAFQTVEAIISSCTPNAIFDWFEDTTGFRITLVLRADIVVIADNRRVEASVNVLHAGGVVTLIVEVTHNGPKLHATGLTILVVLMDARPGLRVAVVHRAGVIIIAVNGKNLAEIIDTGINGADEAVIALYWSGVGRRFNTSRVATVSGIEDAALELVAECIGTILVIFAAELLI